MKAQLWTIWVTEGWLAASHGMFSSMDEIYIPELDLTINSAGAMISTHDRYEQLIDNFLDHNFKEHQPKMIAEIELNTDQEELAKSIKRAKEGQKTLLDELMIVLRKI